MNSCLLLKPVINPQAFFIFAVCTFQIWMSALCLRSPVISCVKTQKAATSAPAPEVTPYSQMERPAKVDGLLMCLCLNINLFYRAALKHYFLF